MHHTRRPILVVLAAATLALAGCGGGDGEDPAVPLGPPGDPLYGFNDNSVRSGQLSAAREAALARRAGAQVVRLTFDWRFAERTPGAYDFAAYDRIYAALRRQGIRPLWTVLFAPSWAWDPGTRCSGDCRLPPGRAAEGRYGRLMARIARRYPTSAGLEVWNEPNLTTFWQPRPDPDRYARLLRVAHRAVKRAAPRMPVAGGAVSNNMHTDDRGNIAAEEFLDRIYRRGAARSMDALSFHPYTVSRSEPLMLRSVGQVLRARREAGDTRTRLWVTELGATTTGTDPDLRFTERQQARTLVDDFCRLTRVPGVRMILVHTLLAPQAGAGSAESGYGVLRPDGSERPAVRALRRASRGGCA